jgi:hypothetical protein
MKLNDVLSKFSIAVTNEEDVVMSKMSGVQPLQVFTEREQVVINNLIRKSLVSKVNHGGTVLVLVNEPYQ